MSHLYPYLWRICLGSSQMEWHQKMTLDFSSLSSPCSCESSWSLWSIWTRVQLLWWNQRPAFPAGDQCIQADTSRDLGCSWWILCSLDQSGWHCCCSSLHCVFSLVPDHLPDWARSWGRFCQTAWWWWRPPAWGRSWSWSPGDRSIWSTSSVWPCCSCQT